MDNKKQEEQKKQGLALNGWDIARNIIVTLIISITVIIVSYIMFVGIRQEVVYEYEQLPTCSLNKLTIGQTYEVNGSVMTLEGIGDYGKDGFKIYFMPLK